MNNIFLLSLILLAYLLGSIPASVWIGKYFYGIDVRTQGSKNAGATNTIRILGWKAGIPVLLFDVFKAFLAVYLPVIFSIGLEGIMLTNFQLLLGLGAVAGHVFPIFAGFKGGKGVASLTGVIIALYPNAFLFILGIFLLAFLIFGYVSLASILSSIALPLASLFIFRIEHQALLIFSLMVAVVVPLLHYKNIGRLIKGKEAKFRFGRRTGP